MAFSIEPIGHIRSPYKEKFAVPRQPSLVTHARSELHLTGEFNQPDTVREIEQFSHLWLLFLFDQNMDKGWTPTVRPPRLGGNERVGVFASRATFRPNHIGMSAVELKSVDIKSKGVILNLGNVDLVDGTPIIDIKPYIPYSDSVPNAVGGYASTKPKPLNVIFCQQALKTLSAFERHDYLRSVIAEILAQDPRPAYKKNKPDSKEYAVRLFDFDVKFTISNETVQVNQIEALA